MQWIVMAKSEVIMYQPYSLVVEVSRTLTGHKIKVMYDEISYSSTDATEYAEAQARILKGFVDNVDVKLDILLQ